MNYKYPTIQYQVNKTAIKKYKIKSIITYDPNTINYEISKQNEINNETKDDIYLKYISNQRTRLQNKNNKNKW